MSDTVGAGDSYMAGLIYGLLAPGAEGRGVTSLESLGPTASKAAAIAVRGPGVAAHGRGN